MVDLLRNGCKEIGIELTDLQAEQFIKYKDLLLEWNEKINLTAITDESEIILKHFVDSLTILPYIKDESKKLIDVGTGAGFPGIPVKILYSEIEVTLMDSLDKRIKFLNEIREKLVLKKLITIHSRAEDGGHNNKLREQFDYATARAVAALPVLLEYCLPFVKKDGYFLAMKGSNIDEITNSQKALDILGGKIEEIKEIVLPFSNDAKRNIIIVRKFRQSSTNYPRKAGKPTKMPLV